MGQVSASSTVLINAEPDAVLAAVADYQTVRPKILSSHYSGYQVLEGGQGAGTVATWKLQATKSRVRDVKASVDVAGKTVYVVDSHSLIFQVFHALPEMTGPRGEPVGAVFGFARDMMFLLEQRRPDYLFCGFDLPGPTRYLVSTRGMTSCNRYSSKT